MQQIPPPQNEEPWGLLTHIQHPSHTHTHTAELLTRNLLLHKHNISSDKIKPAENQNLAWFQVSSQTKKSLCCFWASDWIHFGFSHYWTWQTCNPVIPEKSQIKPSTLWWAGKTEPAKLPSRSSPESDFVSMGSSGAPSMLFLVSPGTRRVPESYETIYTSLLPQCMMGRVLTLPHIFSH